MQIKYVGPKPIISKTGIAFDNQFDDRYTYLNIAVQLLKALDNDYFEDRTYQYEVDSRRLNDQDILEGILHYCGSLDDVVSLDVEEENRLIDSEIRSAGKNTELTEEERAALIKNIELMRNYRLQYRTNETLYNCAVKILAGLVKEAHIDYIIVPMFQRFAAILHSVQDEILRQKFPLETRMEIYEENGKLMVKMEVKNR